MARRETSKYVFEEVTDPSSNEFERVYTLLKRIQKERISKKSFIVQTLDWKKSGELDKDDYHILIAKDKNNNVVSTIVGYYSFDKNFGFVNYTATDEKHEGKGLGTEIRKRLVNLFKEDAKRGGKEKLFGIFSEVDSTDIKRLRSLSKRFGAIALDILYYQPSLSQAKEAIPLQLVFHPADKSEYVEKMDSNILKDKLKGIYEDVYDIKNPEENLKFKEMLDSFKDKKFVPKKVIE